MARVVDHDEVEWLIRENQEKMELAAAKKLASTARNEAAAV
jgi:hypothetical protein